MNDNDRDCNNNTNIDNNDVGEATSIIATTTDIIIILNANNNKKITINEITTKPQAGIITNKEDDQHSVNERDK